MNQAAPFTVGQRVTRDGKPYEVAQVFIDTAPRCGVDWTGQWVVDLKSINPKTGKAWQAGRKFLASEVTP